MRIKWLQLSDIHFNYKNYDSEELRKDFIERICALSSSEPFSHLFLTGDYLYKNGDDSEGTADFINRLVGAMGITWTNVFTVPGNHDHNREQTIQVLSSLGVPLEKIDLPLIDDLPDETICKLLNAFSNYDNVFHLLFGHHYYTNETQPHLIRSLSPNSSLIQFNTAWLDTESRENRPVFCGSRQLQTLLDANKQLTSNAINIAIGHHPLDDLVDKDRTINQFARNNITVYLCGHRHRPSVKYYHDKDIIQITCPGGYNDGYSEGGYVWGIIDTVCDIYRAEIYNWNDGKWCIESRIEGTDDKGNVFFDTNRNRHNSKIAAVDLKLYDGHISINQIENAIGAPVLSEICTCNCENPFDWQGNEREILDVGNEIKSLIAKGYQVHLFPIAPIPFLIKLGFELQNNSKIYIHQYERDTQRWLLNGTEPNQLSFSKQLHGAKDLAISIATSARIEENLIRKALNAIPYDLVSIELAELHIGKPLYYNTIVHLASQISEYLYNVRNGYSRIHVFASVPAGLAIEIGRHLLQSMFRNIFTYNFSGNKYEQAFILAPDMEAINEDFVELNSDTFYIDAYRQSVVFIPVVGDIACGDLSDAISNTSEFFPIPASLVDSHPHFILRAKGDSMKNAGIEDGDYILIRQQGAADEGRIVVALIDGNATLKRIHFDAKRKKVVLHPENEEYQDNEYDNVNLQGVAIMVMKRL